MNTEFERALSKVLQKEHLDNLAVLRMTDFFDEVPIYSRYDQVEMLAEHGNVDLLLLEGSVNFLKQVVEYKEGSSQFFAAITFFDYGGTDPIVPAIFICNGWVRQRLEGKLVLQAPKSRFVKQIQNWIRRLGMDNEYRVLEDRETVPDAVKAFVGHRNRLFPNQSIIDDFRED